MKSTKKFVKYFLFNKYIPGEVYHHPKMGLVKFCGSLLNKRDLIEPLEARSRFPVVVPQKALRLPGYNF